MQSKSLCLEFGFVEPGGCSCNPVSSFLKLFDDFPGMTLQPMPFPHIEA